MKRFLNVANEDHILFMTLHLSEKFIAPISVSVIHGDAVKGGRCRLLRLRLVACSSLNGIHPTIVYGVFPHFSFPLDDSQEPVSYTHLDVYKRQVTGCTGSYLILSEMIVLE